MTWLSETGIADIYCLKTGLTGNGGGINEDYAGPRTEVATFNFHNLNTAATYQINVLYSHTSNAKILDGQTYTIENGRADFGSGNNIMGKILVKDQGAARITANLSASSTGSIEVQAGGAIIVTDPGRLEAWDPSQIITPAATTLCFGTNNIALYDATQPRLHELIAKSDIGFNWHRVGAVNITGDGLMLGDGKFLMIKSYSGNTATISATSILGAAPGADSIGLASGGSGNWNDQKLQIDCLLDIWGVDLNIGCTTLEIVGADNNRIAAVGTVVLNSTVTANDIKVASGYVTFRDASDLILTGKVMVTGGQVVIGASSDEFNDTQAVHMQFDGGMLNCNENQALLDLSTSNIALNSGSYGYFTPSETRLADLSIAENYVQDTSGARIRDAADVVTVTGTLSGNGGWGGSGKMRVEGALAPGASIGELTGLSALDVADGATYEWQVASAAGTAGEEWDLVTATDLTFLGELIFDIDASLLTGAIAGEDFIVASATGTLSGPTSYTINLPDTGSWSGGSLAVVGNDLVLIGLSGSASQAGDTDGDGDVDAADYIILKTNMGAGTGAGAAAGDFDGDGDVDWEDLQILQDSYGTGSPGASGSIPEPATLGLLAVGALAVIRRRQGFGGQARRRAIVDRPRR